ncbi:hypothetical protein H3H36_05375 [Duganella sp. FT3S]|uniref:FecR protein domain-containing protein n=1 Tax=Rugamonas fusca TaxID=2758568 RepID=A0A7W2I5Z6_9BURK|nr:DUF6600 domain-containing protein [Rugamonas fusca]MBA5604790.1 hypothetical protein [Rugamonas fusca]
MSRSTLTSAVLAALLAWTLPALADDIPGRVGRISSVEGQVTVVGEGDPADAMLNWPVTTGDHLSTASGARGEFRVGPAAIRLDGDTDLEVVQLDDDNVRLRLNYGSASVHLRDGSLLRDFELTTPQARVTMVEPGTVRVDAERLPDTTVVNVLAGVARVDGAGSQLVVRAGYRGEVSSDDVRTGAALRDGFDSWAELRDRQYETSIASRYVPSEVTGYEELDRYGSWTDSPDYGPLWTPRVVATDWAPYRDGQWIWMVTFGWTWVDNAPWGYAPSHYGRWVMVNRRWCWAPGRYVGRPAWAPALVGWVGGDRLQASHRDGRRGPGLGWYPLAPHEAYAPPFHLSPEHERRLVWTHNGRPAERRDGPHEGVTVVPRDRFDAGHVVPVHAGPQVILPPAVVRTAPLVAAPAPAAPTHAYDRRRFDGDDRRPERGGAAYAPQGQAVQPQQRLPQNTLPGQVPTVPVRPSYPQPSQPASRQQLQQQQQQQLLQQQQQQQQQLQQRQRQDEQQRQQFEEQQRRQRQQQQLQNQQPVQPLTTQPPGRLIEPRGTQQPAQDDRSRERFERGERGVRYEDGRRQIRPEGEPSRPVAQPVQAPPQQPPLQPPPQRVVVPQQQAPSQPQPFQVPARPAAQPQATPQAQPQQREQAHPGGGHPANENDRRRDEEREKRGHQVER